MIARIPVLLLAALVSCSHDAGPSQAMRTFAAFQQALRQHDEHACRELLTLESQQLLAEMPWAQVASREPLQVLGAHRRNRDGHAFRVDVADPNKSLDRTQFVVVREYGRLVVDLIASAGLTAQVVEASSSREQFEPRVLTPADHDRIREYALTQAPR